MCSPSQPCVRDVLKNIEVGTCRFLYAHEKNTIMETCKLVYPQTIGSTCKKTCRKWIFLIIAQVKELTLSGDFINLQVLQFLVRYSKDIPMGCKDTVSPQLLLENHNVNCSTFEKIVRQPYNDKLCLSRALALHLHGNDKLKEETSKNSIFFSLTAKKEIRQSIKVATRMTFQNLRHVPAQIFSIWHWFCWRRTPWWICSSKYSKIWIQCQALALEQSLLLLQQHHGLIQSCLIQYLWQVFLEKLVL